MNDFDLATYIEASTSASGVPTFVQDPAVLALAAQAIAASVQGE